MKFFYRGGAQGVKTQSIIYLPYFVLSLTKLSHNAVIKSNKEQACRTLG